MEKMAKGQRKKISVLGGTMSKIPPYNYHFCCFFCLEPHKEKEFFRSKTEILPKFPQNYTLKEIWKNQKHKQKGIVFFENFVWYGTKNYSTKLKSFLTSPLLLCIVCYVRRSFVLVALKYFIILLLIFKIKTLTSVSFLSLSLPLSL